MKQGIREKIFVMSMVFFFVSTTLLYYWQSIRWNGLYESDLILHIEMAQNPGEKDSYSVFIFLINILRVLGDGTTIGIALFLSLVTLGTVVATSAFLQELFPKMEKTVCCWLAFVAVMVMPIYVPKMNPWYLGMWVGNVWHNPTYLCMRFLALCILFVLFRMLKRKTTITLRQWSSLSVLLVLANAFKPNFVLVLVPTLGAFLMVELIKTKGKSLRKSLEIVTAFIPSGIVLVIQYMLMFGREKEGGLGIDFAYFWLDRAWHPGFGVLQSMLFIIIVVFYNLKRLKEDRVYQFVLGFWAIGLLEYLFLIETGSRMTHGNWTWGFYFGMFLLTLYSIGIWNDNYNDLQGKINSIKIKVYAMIAGGGLILQLFSGIVYFIRLLGGASYR